MSAGAPAKMLANKQLIVKNTDGTTHSYMTLKAMMAVVNYARCDALVSQDLPSVDDNIHYKVNLAQTVGGANLALCDGGANICIKGNDMRVLHYNNNGRSVSIGIAGDHQLTGAPLCTAVSVAKSNRGLVKLFWHQCVEVKTQQKSIISNF